MGFLLGLDILRRHQVVIDLQKSVLRIGTEEVPFLAEKDIPHLKEEQMRVQSQLPMEEDEALQNALMQSAAEQKGNDDAVDQNMNSNNNSNSNNNANDLMSNILGALNG